MQSFFVLPYPCGSLCRLPVISSLLRWTEEVTGNLAVFIHRLPIASSLLHWTEEETGNKKRVPVKAPAVAFEMKPLSVDLVDHRVLLGEVGDLGQILIEELAVEEDVFAVVAVLEIGICDEVTDSTLLAVTLELLDVAAAT